MATHIKNIVKCFIRKSKNKVKDKEEIKKIINLHTDRALKKEIRVESISGKKIEIAVTSAMVAYEVNLRKNKILEEIKKRYSQIESIKIKIAQ